MGGFPISDHFDNVYDLILLTRPMFCNTALVMLLSSPRQILVLPTSVDHTHRVDHLEKHQEEDQYYYIQYIRFNIIVLPKIHVWVLHPSVDHPHKVAYLEKHQDYHEEEELREEDIEDQVGDQKDQEEDKQDG